MTTGTQTRTAGSVQNFSDGLGVGTWTIPDGANVAKTDHGGGITNPVRLSNFGFAIPPGATIKGYELKAAVQASQNDGDYAVTTHTVKILTASGLVGNNLGGAQSWPTSPTSLTFGGPTSLGGASLTPSQVNDAAFGGSVSAFVNSPEGAFGFARIVSAELTIHFEE